MYINLKDDTRLTEAQVKNLKDNITDYFGNDIHYSKTKPVKDRPAPYLNPLLCATAIFLRVSILLISKGMAPLIRCGLRFGQYAGSQIWASYCALKFDQYDVSKTFFMKTVELKNPEGYCEKFLDAQNKLLAEMKDMFAYETTEDMIHNLRYTVYCQAERGTNSYYLAKTYSHGPEEYNIAVCRRVTNEFKAIISLCNAVYPQYTMTAAKKKLIAMSQEEFQKVMTTCLLYTECINPADIPLSPTHRDEFFKYASKHHPSIKKDYITVCAKAIHYGLVDESEFKNFQTPLCKVYYSLISKELKAFSSLKAKNQICTIKDIFGIEINKDNILLAKRSIDPEDFEYDFEAYTNADYSDLEPQSNEVVVNMPDFTANKMLISSASGQNQPFAAQNQPVTTQKSSAGGPGGSSGLNLGFFSSRPGATSSLNTGGGFEETTQKKQSTMDVE